MIAPIYLFGRKEMRSITYEIPGNPVPLARPRFANNHVWDSQKPTKFSAGLFVARCHDNAPLFTGPISLTVVFYLPKPKKLDISHFDTFHYSVPDLDNLLKLVGDVCNGIAYKDDAIIASIHAEKRYSRNPRTVFTLSEL